MIFVLENIENIVIYNKIDITWYLLFFHSNDEGFFSGFLLLLLIVDVENAPLEIFTAPFKVDRQIKPCIRIKHLSEMLKWSRLHLFHEL